jgi:uncharacterized repeat protein (TIGR03803 family)
LLEDRFAPAQISTVASFIPYPNGAVPLSDLAVDSHGNLYGTSGGGAYNVGTIFEVAAGSGTVTALASFNNTDGASPSGGLVLDSSGNLFGATRQGGAFGYGTVFELVAGSGTITTLASFNNTNGANPECTLVEDSIGDLFGTAGGGGAYGVGTVFEVGHGSNSITTLASFNRTNGGGPYGRLVMDSNGNLYGAASFGGANDYGTVFELAAGSATITSMASFDINSSGATPLGLIKDSNGNLFGTTSHGGSGGGGTIFEVASGSNSITALASIAPFSFFNGGLVLDGNGNLFGTTGSGSANADGTVFELAAGSSTITTVASFTGTNGVGPNAGLIADNSGNFYGTTSRGGANGTGTVFEVPAGTATITTLASFNPMQPDLPSGLIQDSGGNLYGTAQAAYGIVFKIASGTNTITTLASFNNANGSFPGGLVEDSHGDLFGITGQGGIGYGTVFELAAGSNSITTIATFNGMNGASPTSNLVLDSVGDLFGTTFLGGSYNEGTLFEVAAGSGTITTLASFNYTSGDYPVVGPVFDSKGNLFGATGSGGANGDGMLFELAAGSNNITTLASYNGTSGTRVSGLIVDSNDNLFGTTSDSFPDYGTVFKLSAGSNTITTLASFNGANGRNPGSLVEDSSGDLFGTTVVGGTNNDGTVFELASGSSTITSLASFNDANGNRPSGAVVLDPAGNLYGTTGLGGAAGVGTVFSIHVSESRHWTGSGSNNLWTNPANWDTAPVSGDNLVFAGTPETTVNDFPAGTMFGSIQFFSSSDPSQVWQLNGNQIVVASDIVAHPNAITGFSVVNINLPIQLNVDINLRSDSTVPGSAISLSNTIDTAGHTLTVTGQGKVSLLGNLIGSGSLALTQGAFEVAGSGTINCSGQVQVAGTLQVDGTLTSGTIQVSSGGLLDGSGTISATSGSIQVASGGLLDGSGTINSSGQVEVEGTMHLNGTLTSASIQVAGGLLDGSGTINSTGQVQVGGTLQIDGTLNSAGIQVSHGFLDGFGRINAPVIASAYAGSVVSPGKPLGILTTGSLTLLDFSTLAVELDGSTAGLQYNQLNVNGSVNLTKAVLQLSLGYVPVVGTTFTIINNDFTDPVTGTFAGILEGGTLSSVLAEGATFSIGSSAFRISYRGGDGNDVVLTCINPVILTLPPDQTFKAPTANGANIQFVGATATDVITANGSPTITYSPAPGSQFPVGTTVVTATATDADGNQQTGTFKVIVQYTPPTASIGNLPPNNTIGDNSVAVFTASAVHPLNPNSADVFIYNWTVSRNGNIFASGTDLTIAFLPDDNGTDIITLTATDSDGATSAPATATITVVNAPPIVSMTAPPLPIDAFNTPTAPAGMLLNFTAMASDSTADMQHGFGYAWSVTQGGAPFALPAGTVTNTQNFSFIPTSPGSYAVTVVVTDKDGGATTIIQPLDIASMDPLSSLYDPNSLQNAVNTQAYWTNEGSLFEDGNFYGSYPQPAVLILQADPSQIDASLNALNAIIQPTVNDFNSDSFAVPVIVTLNLTNSSYSDLNFDLQPGITVIVNGVNGSTTVVGHSPALTITAGNVTINNVIFTTATDSPTILVAGGNLALRNDVVQESTGFADAAISVTGGGTVDLGSTSDPGNNTININGAGQPVQNSTSTPITTAGNTFKSNGTVLPGSLLSSTAVTSSAAMILLNQAVTFTATVQPSGTGTPTGTVDFFNVSTNIDLGNVTLSGGRASITTTALPAGNSLVQARYSGDATSLPSLGSAAVSVQYKFSGFLSPLNSNLAMALNRTVPIKFQLTDFNNKSTGSLSSVVSLQVLNSLGTNVLTNAGSTALRCDSSANQFIANWSTKGLSAGTYTVKLVLNDGMTYTKQVALSANGSNAALLVDGLNSATTTVGALLGGDIQLYVDNSNGDLTADELARVQDAVTAVDAVTVPYGVTITEVTDPTQADVTLNMDTTSAVGGFANGVLGCTTDGGQITIIAGWNYYTGSGITQIGATQYDFETVVTHELGHALGLGHSANSASVMFATLNTGEVNRSMTVADLNVADSDSGACGLHASPVSGQAIDFSFAPDAGSAPSTGNFQPAQNSAVDGHQAGLNAFLAYWPTTDFSANTPSLLNDGKGLSNPLAQGTIDVQDDFWSSIAGSTMLEQITDLNGHFGH